MLSSLSSQSRYICLRIVAEYILGGRTFSAVQYTPLMYICCTYEHYIYIFIYCAFDHFHFLRCMKTSNHMAVNNNNNKRIRVCVCGVESGRANYYLLFYYTMCVYEIQLWISLDLFIYYILWLMVCCYCCRWWWWWWRVLLSPRTSRAYVYFK